MYFFKKGDKLTIDILQAELLMAIFKLKSNEMAKDKALELVKLADELNSGNLEFIDNISTLEPKYQYPDINYFLTDDLDEIRIKINQNIANVKKIIELIKK